MSQPFVATSTLVYPPDTDLPQVSRTASVTGIFTQIAEERLVLAGTGIHTVGFGSIASPGAKALMIEVDAGALLQPIGVTFNGADTPVEIAPGGFLVLCNPVPVTGLVSLAIEHTSNATVHVRLLA